MCRVGRGLKKEKDERPPPLSTVPGILKTPTPFRLRKGSPVPTGGVRTAVMECHSKYR